MSQITAVSSLPLGRRIAEIMDEKGAAFSLRAFAPRVGLSKDTLGRVIVGERNIKPSELNRIAEGLSITTARLKQTDIAAATTELLERLESKKDLKRALQLAEKIHTVAVGLTERCDATFHLAHAAYSLEDTERAHALLLQANVYAQKIYEKYGETDRLYNVLSRLMITFTVRKEFSKLADLLGHVETIFSRDSVKLGAIYYSKAMIAEQFKNTEQLGENLYKSLECYRLTNNQRRIGRAESNVGYFEFKQGNYKKAKGFLQVAVQHLEGDTHYQLIATKELAKTLIKLEEVDSAVEILEDNMNHLVERPDLKAKFLLLMAIAKQDISYAEMVFSLTNPGEKMIQLACKYLTKYYISVGDSNAVLKYATINESLSFNCTDIIHEEDL